MLSPDQKRLAIGDIYGIASQFDLQTGREIATPMNHGGAIRSLAYSPDASILASGQWKNGVTRLWHTSTNTSTKVGLPQKGTVYGVAFSPDGALIATANQDGSASVWNCLTGEEVFTPKLVNVNEHKVRAARAVAFDPDGRLIVIGKADNAQLWDLQTRSIVGAPYLHGNTVTSAIFSPDGSKLLTGAEDGSARQWDVTSGLQLGNPMLHPSTVIKAAYSPNGKNIATATQDGTVQLWDADTGTAISEPLKHTRNVMNLNFAAEGDQLMTAVLNEGVYLWELNLFPTDVVNKAHLTKSIQLWSGLVADSDGNTRELTVAETDQIRSELGSIDALTAFQAGEKP